MSDIFRDTWVRYLGYTNEVGEAFRHLIPVSWVRASYAVATGYVLADTVDKTHKMYKSNAPTEKVVIAAGDALLWQAFATIIIPGFTINRICYVTFLLLKKPVSDPRTRSLLTVGAGLVSIPFIIHPIDKAVTMVMDETYRKVLR